MGKLSENSSEFLSENTTENAESSKSTMLKMGFPLFKKYNSPTHSNLHTEFRMVSKMTPNSHMELKHEASLSNESYQCPQCKVHVSQLPIQCPTCNLQLVTSAHLARSHHHLFPVKKFKTEYVESQTGDKIIKKSSCDACGIDNVEVGLNPDTGKRFCLDCELFMREKLHFSF